MRSNEQTLHIASDIVVNGDNRVPGNMDLTREQRARRIRCFYKPYRVTIDGMLHRLRVRGIVPAFTSIHSVTPQLADRQGRHWQTGLMRDEDPRIPVPLLVRPHGHLQDMIAGDHEPYSDRYMVDHSIEYHARVTGLPHASMETRHDLINGEDGAGPRAARLDESPRDIIVDPDLYRFRDN